MEEQREENGRRGRRAKTGAEEGVQKENDGKK